MDHKKPPPRTQYSWKPPIDRLEDVETLIAEFGRGVNPFLNWCVFGRRRSTYPRPLQEAAGLLLAFLAPIRDQTRRLENAAHDDQHLFVLEQIRDLLLEIRSALFLILGRKP